MQAFKTTSVKAFQGLASIALITVQIIGSMLSIDIVWPHAFPAGFMDGVSMFQSPGERIAPTCYGLPDTMRLFLLLTWAQYGPGVCDNTWVQRSDLSCTNT